MVRKGAKRTSLVLLIAAASLVLAACGGAKVSSTSSAAASSSTSTPACGTFNLAVNPWVGYEADAAVVAYVAQTKLGCNVVKKNLSEEISWQGFATGEVDAILENWGHADLTKKYITEQKVAQDAGPTGNQGIIGWYVDPWLAQKYPDILDYKNLNKYASMFKTSESGSKGAFLDGDPSYVTNDEAIIKNLGLNFKVVYTGSEAALITAFRNGETQKKPVIGYFYEPQWFLSEVPLKHVALPPYTPGCDADPKTVACDYPPYPLNKVVSTKFATSGSPAYNLVKNFNWTNDDQNEVAKYIAQDKMTDDQAAKKWVDANPDKVAAWLAG
ncbi:MAG TPA: ABC transporter substrate-binding protein [Candidatus Nanopelagicaceae bacterium]|nr:ABC transporter substrate-binding protein [Candidatus Nanopelagicaceae bacterium]